MDEILTIHTKLWIFIMKGWLPPPSIISKMEVFSMKIEIGSVAKVEVLAPCCKICFFKKGSTLDTYTLLA